MSPENRLDAGSRDAIISARARERINRLIETYLYLCGAIIISTTIIFDAAAHRAPLAEILYVRRSYLLASGLLIISPIIFRLIFGALPLEWIRRNRAQRQVESKDLSRASVVDEEIRTAEIRALSDMMSASELSEASAIKLFAYYSFSSRRLSQSIYARAGVYLLVGVGVAFSGLFFFYTLTSDLPPGFAEQKSIEQDMAFAIPRIGILFFIELIAFFFLRQYRSAMDEFRYYEAVKRNREETLALINIISANGASLDAMELVKNNSFFSRVGGLEKGASTEIIESRKLEKNELDLMEKVVELIAKSKK
ncbi:hypothetical protein B0G80_1662 [Paraburkholderia sp. BL6669N2]|uniref:hypothetical protein n=1 Tax=Paraburkholderia sp. BL6669N2 TaxID=1938807 RepID=UPI000E37128E|nr:hypothetical protein [Paraburkholderia sp. BL6669N2]REG58937.1 hypothetical protein B0G80_1662 [Paraburkholderia sp. BL6669N2]